MNDPNVHDPRPPEQLVGGGLAWTGIPSGMAFGMADLWVGPEFSRAGGLGHGGWIEAPFLAEGYAEDWERLERYAVRQRFRAGDEIIRRGQG
jgi:hypothetical protein